MWYSSSDLFSLSNFYLFVDLVTLGYAISAIGRLIPVKSRQVPLYNPRNRLWVYSSIFAAVAIGMLGAGYALSLPSKGGHQVKAAGPGHRPLPPGVTTFQVGVFEPGETVSFAPVRTFASATGVKPHIVVYYSGWQEPFLTNFAQEVHAAGAKPFVQIEPDHVNVTKIAQGKYDNYLRSYAGQVRAYGSPVLISFAPEANGDWYSWGWGHTSPQVWIAAWRHMVTVFRKAGATNVIWVWVMNRTGSGKSTFKDYWPGSPYVNWVGLDGYYFKRYQTFSSILASPIQQIRKITHKPLILSETGIGQVVGQARGIPNLFAGVSRYHVAGLVWFDMCQHGGLYHQCWRLEGHPKAIRAFRSGVRLAESSFQPPLP